MHIIVDRNIPYAFSAFHKIGHVTMFETGDLRPEMLRDADILVVRSETKVDERLLEGSAVRFVGTATIGTDHIHIPYLTSRGISFASAPGCNANSVSEYIVAGLLHLAKQRGIALREMSLGVVGVGNVGSRVVTKAEGLGMRVLQNDPPLQRVTGERRFRPLSDLLGADIITVHVPLTREGTDATYHLFDSTLLGRMKKGSILINTSRGAVVETRALKEVLSARHLADALIDVWEGEPLIDVGLLDKIIIGTPHIAGYSLEGKVNAVRTIYTALCSYLSVEPSWNPTKELPPVEMDRINVASGHVNNEEDILQHVVEQRYDIVKDDERLRAMLALPPEERGLYFRRLRTDYPVRREFSNSTVVLPFKSGSLSEKLTLLGFNVEVRTAR